MLATIALLTVTLVYSTCSMNGLEFKFANLELHLDDTMAYSKRAAGLEPLSLANVGEHRIQMECEGLNPLPLKRFHSSAGQRPAPMVRSHEEAK